MANRDYSPVMFALEKNVVFLSAHITFDAAGAPILDTMNSKGICNVALNTTTFSGTTTSSATSVGTVSSFANLFVGMSVTGTGLQANTKIATLVPGTDSLTLDTPVNTGTIGSLTVSGGQYVVQFGTQAGVRLDTYYKLLSITASWDETSGSATGTATQAQLAPAAPNMFMVTNKTTVRTIPATATSPNTDCTVVLQFGSGSGTSFVAANPNPGDSVRLLFVLGNSSAI